jgi:hypothetical protein
VIHATLAALAIAAAAAEPGEALLSRARAERDAGRLDEALGALDALLAGSPAHEALLDRGQVLAWQGRTREALDAYRAFRAHHPHRALEADLRIAQAQAWADELPAALASLAPWVERGERQAVLDDATYRSWAGDLDGVVARLRGWLAAHPDDRDARLRLAKARSWQSRWDEARGEYERLLARSPADGEATLGLAQLDLWAGRPAAARARIEALPPAARELPDLRLLEARLAVAEGRPASARGQLGPLLKGPSGREAEQLMDELVAGHGLWTRLGGTETRSNEGLVQKTPALTLRAPVGQGHADVEAGWSEVSLGRETRGGAVTSLLVSQPFGARVSADAGLGFRGRFAGARGLSARGGATVLVLPSLALRLDAGRSLLDFTPTAVDRGDAITTLEGGLTWTLGEGSRTLAAGGGYGFLDAGTRRGSLFLSAEQRAAWWRLRFRGGALVRGFGYSESRPELGFFNPGRYRYAGLTGGVTWGRGTALELDAALQGGWQKVNADAAQFAWGYGLTAAWGREGVQLLLVWSQSFAGLPVVSAGDLGSYREHALRLALRLAGGG